MPFSKLRIQRTFQWLDVGADRIVYCYGIFPTFKLGRKLQQDQLFKERCVNY